MSDMVAPYTGAWIEIGIYSKLETKTKVAPYTGAWIEIIFSTMRWAIVVGSLPTRERGLKFNGKEILPRLLTSLPTRERGLK